MRAVANQGMDDVHQFLGHSICDGLPTRDNGPEVVPDLCILGKLWDLGATALVGYSLLYLMSLSPPCVLMSLSVWVSLFFSLTSLEMGLHMLVSDNN